MNYLVRALSNKETQIAKFEDSREPSEVYKVTFTRSNNYYHCSCMGFRRDNSQEHKHIKMVKAFDEFNFNCFDEEMNGKQWLL